MHKMFVCLLLDAASTRFTLAHVVTHRQRRQLVLRAVRCGGSAREVAEQFGIAAFTVRRWCKANGVALPRGNPGELARFTNPDELREYCASCGGITVAAEKLGCSRQGIYLRLEALDRQSLAT